MIYEATEHQADNPQQQHVCETAAQAKSLHFLERLSELRKRLSLDAEAARSGDPSCRSLDEVIYCYPGFEAVIDRAIKPLRRPRASTGT